MNPACQQLPPAMSSGTSSKSTSGVAEADAREAERALAHIKKLLDDYYELKELSPWGPKRPHPAIKVLIAIDSTVQAWMWDNGASRTIELLHTDLPLKNAKKDGINVEKEEGPLPDVKLDANLDQEKKTVPPGLSAEQQRVVQANRAKISHVKPLARAEVKHREIALPTTQ